MNELQEDYISQSVELSAEAIHEYYVRILDAAKIFDITDVEIVGNVQKLSNVAKSLVYAHAELSNYAKVETVKSAIKTLNGIQTYFKEQPDEITQEVQKDAVDVLISYLQNITQDHQLELFDL